MKPYLVAATNKEGRRDTFARDAASPEHLFALLEREGFRDIELVDDEVMANLRAQRPERLKPKSAADYRFEARLSKGPVPDSAWWWQAARNNALQLALAAAGIAWGIWARSPATIITVLAVASLWVWLLHRAHAVAKDYNALLAAFAHGELDEADALIERMLDSSFVQGNDQLNADLLYKRACVMARRGRVDDGLALVQPLAQGPLAGNGVHLSQVASIHYAADRLDDFIDGLEHACEASGRNNTMLLDLAFVHVRMGDPQRAAALLSQVQPKLLPAIHQPVHRAIAGIAHLRDGEHAQAAGILRESVTALDAFAANPAVWPFNGMLSGYLALALLGCGRREDAHAVLAPWRQVALHCLEPASRQRLASELPE